MRSVILSLAILSASAQVVPRTTAREVKLEGCPNPTSVAMGLAKLRESDWRQLSLDRLRSIWPTTLVGKDCDEGGCRGVWSPDRVIEGQCQCCAVFLFKTHGTSTQPRTEWLDNIVINFATPDRSALVSIAQSFAKALGFADADWNSMTSERGLDLMRETTGRNGEDLSLLRLQITSEGNLWRLNLNSSQNVPK